MPIILLVVGAGVAMGIVATGAKNAEETVARGVSKNTGLAIGLAGAALLVYAWRKSK